MNRAAYLSAAAAALVIVGGVVWYAATSDVGVEAPVANETAREAFDRALGESVAAADWIRGYANGGSIEGGESGIHAWFKIRGADGREAWAYLVLVSGTWRLVSLTEGPPQCDAVEKYGFASAMISECTVGEAQTVADALAAALAGDGAGSVRLVGTVELPPDPSCGCVFLTSGGASVRVNVSAAALAAAGINVGDTVVVSGGLGNDLSLDVASVIRAGADGTPEAAAGFGSSPSGSTGGDDGDDRPASSPTASAPRPSGTAPEPTAAPSSGAVSGGGTSGGVVGFPSWTPRRRYTTAWYTNPLDLDASAGGDPSLVD